MQIQKKSKEYAESFVSQYQSPPWLRIWQHK